MGLLQEHGSAQDKQALQQLMLAQQQQPCSRGGNGNGWTMEQMIQDDEDRGGEMAVSWRRRFLQLAESLDTDQSDRAQDL